MRSSRLLAWLVLAGVALHAPGARAQGLDAMLHRGRELRRQRQLEEALTVFREAFETSVDPRALAEVAATEGALDRWGDAEDHYREALGAADDAWVREHRGELERALDEARNHIGVLELSGTPFGATVSLDHHRVGTLPLPQPLRVSTGAHLLEVTAPGHLSFVRQVMLNPGTPTRETVALRREFDTSPPAASTTQPTVCPPGLDLRNGLCYPRYLPTGGVPPALPRWLVGGGAALAGVGILGATLLWVSGNAIEDAFLQACGGRPAPPSCLARWRDDQDFLDGRALGANLLWVAAVLGTAAAVTGAVLWSRVPSREQPRVAWSLVPGGVALRW
ncbi:MAG: PEGA domain-containing protein [Deltaproteobacteria bacterium]|nr:PEGA domain-containing protein [Deltaproteobacteria bacterium]